MGLIHHVPRDIHTRNIGDDIRSYTERFNTFDKCMAENVCKIPVIVAIAVVGLVLISLTICLLRCCLCGYACCACCCGGCGGRKQKRPKIEVITQGPMPVRHSMAAQKYAYFGDSKNDDALPVMPSLGGDVQKEYEMSPVQGMAPFAPRPHETGVVGGGLQGRSLTGQAPVTRTPSPGGYPPRPMRPVSVSSTSDYSAVGAMPSPQPMNGGFAPPHQGYLRQQGYPPQRDHLGAPQPGFMGGNRNTVQNAYNDVAPINPYQYQGGPRKGQQLQEKHVHGELHEDRRRQQEWSVI